MPRKTCLLVVYVTVEALHIKKQSRRCPTVRTERELQWVNEREGERGWRHDRQRSRSTEGNRLGGGRTGGGCFKMGN